jgi:hypothetical protein
LFPLLAAFIGKGVLVPKYLFQGAYIGDGLKGLATEGGTPRVEAARQLFGSLAAPWSAFTSPWAPGISSSSATCRTT